MLPKKYRLEKEKIAEIAKKGKRVRKNGFEIRYWYDDSLENSKFAVIVSKKVSKLATDRNTIKRKFRAAIAKLNEENYFKKGGYIFLIYSVELKDKKSDEIHEEIGRRS